MKSSPMRNAPCPCGTRKKYKRCCGQVAGEAPETGEAGPDSRAAQANFQRGLHWLQAGQPAAAIASLTAAIQSDPAHFEAHHALGSVLMQSGRLGDATGVLLSAVALRPSSAPALADLGAAYDRQDLHDQAIEAYQRALALAPRLEHVQVRLGQLHAMYSRAAAASLCFERAAEVKPKSTAARLYRSDALLLRGDVAGAEQWARKAVALEPGNSAAHGTLGGVLYSQGRFEDAATCFEAALRLNPLSAKCWDGLAHCRKYAGEDGAILARMRDVLRRNDLPDAARMTIHFAAGKVCDDAGDYAGAMAEFDAGNTLRAKQSAFDRAGMAALVERNIQVFTPAFMARNVAQGDPDDRPLFIVGMYRSGTTLAEQILSSHPEIAAGGELTVWGPADLEIDEATGGFATGAGPAYLSVLREIGPAARRVTDKLPTNIFRLGAIHALLPNARIVHCRRDPLDTCLSIYATLFNTRIPFCARMDDLAFYYRQYLRMAAHWRAVLPNSVFLEVDYERLVMDREAETRRMIAFSGLDWDDACLSPERNGRVIGTASAWQARQSVYSDSVGRWRRYAPWAEKLRALLEDEAQR